ncbi:uncharacterized protein Bfra_008095 [Botrytis fragariae]|uniref:NYN domain-containing protein n=1 Tax=Botrytis fragariae TaxID=1964551 RepID=A0A8H6EGS8_9HELO|nr:uncharacterized protein Bfra_008095 [Botrytis fragariae]KAF5871576.1 hypothetical protein Bfra_008095 [Botrytis fragariae]
MILTKSSGPINPEEVLHPPSLSESKSSSELKTAYPKSDSTLRLDRMDQISALADTEAASEDQENTSISRQNLVVVLWDVDNKRISPSYDDVVTSLKKFAGHFGELINILAFGSHLTFSEIGTKLIEAGVHIERVGTAPQEADAALRRAWKKWKMTQLEKEPHSFIWLILVTDDAGFRYMLRSGKRSEFGVVVVNEFFTKLSLEGDLRMPWPQLKAGNYSLDGLADHIVGISTMDPIDKVILKLKIQLKAKSTMKRELLLRTMQKRSILEQRLKHTSEKDLQSLEILEEALRKLEDPSGHKTMRGIDGSILKLETELKARIEAKKTKSSTDEVTPLGDMSDEEFLRNLSHTDIVEGLMRLAINSSSPEIDSKEWERTIDDRPATDIMVNNDPVDPPPQQTTSKLVNEDVQSYGCSRKSWGQRRDGVVNVID